MLKDIYTVNRSPVYVFKRNSRVGVIERVDGPTPWVSPIVVAPKPKAPGKIHVCVDMRRANAAIQRERYATPTIKEWSAT